MTCDLVVQCTWRKDWGINILEHVQEIDTAQTQQAEAALQLLRSLAKAGDDPEMFMQACLDWSRLSDEAMSLPDFMSVLSMLSGPASPSAPHANARASIEHAAQDVFSVHADGTVANISQELSTRLALQTGSKLPSEAMPSMIGAQTWPRIVELADRYGIKRQIQLYPMSQDATPIGFVARAVLTRLAPNVRDHLKQSALLTNSEMNILELVLQRHSLEQVADIRGSKMNTIRTHVARLIQKLECHSLVEAVATTMEIASALTTATPLDAPAQDLKEDGARFIALETPGTRAEYRRYGAAQGHPIIILHSLEYGYLPSEQMVQAARAQNINLIFPIRPGFGGTTPAESIADAARSIEELIKVLHLQNVSLIGLSTAAPLALAVNERSSRVTQTWLINYGLNVGDKLKAIQPKWVGGMLRMALNSTASFTLGIRSVRSMIRTFGGLRFYRMLYRNQDADLAFLESHEDLFRHSADYFADADRTNIRLDIESAFLKNSDAETQLLAAENVTVINSADQHGVGPEASQADAERLGVAFRSVRQAGRNWMFQSPETLFREVMSESAQFVEA